MSSYKKFIIALITILTASAGALAIFLFTQPNSTNKPTDQKITITGTIACLPHKNSDQPHTLECAMGLKTTDNKYYALQNLPVQFTSSIKTLTIEGLKKADSLANDKYDTLGTVVVQTVKEN